MGLRGAAAARSVGLRGQGRELLGGPRGAGLSTEAEGAAAPAHERRVALTRSPAHCPGRCTLRPANLSRGPLSHLHQREQVAGRCQLLLQPRRDRTQHPALSPPSAGASSHTDCAEGPAAARRAGNPNPSAIPGQLAASCGASSAPESEHSWEAGRRRPAGGCPDDDCSLQIAERFAFFPRVSCALDPHSSTAGGQVSALLHSLEAVHVFGGSCSAQTQHLR